MDIFNIIVAAFAGAFFAYVFGRIADLFKSIYKRKSDHYNELVYLERFLNLHLNTTADNISTLREMVKNLRNGFLEISLLNIYELPEKSLMSIRNMPYLNKLLGFVISLRKINHDLELTEHWNTELRTALVQKNIDITKYNQEASRLADNVEVLVKSLESFEDEIIDLLSENAVYLKRDKTILGRIIKVDNREISTEEFTKAKEKLLMELEKSRETNRQKIKDYTQGTILAEK